MSENARMLLTAVYDRVGLSIKGEPSEAEVAELGLLFLTTSRRLNRTAAPESATQDTANDEIIPVDRAGTTTIVRRSSVRWVQAQGDYARLHTNTGSYLLRVPLAQLETRWANAGFLRIHRSFLVCLPAISEVRPNASGYTVRVGTGEDAAVLPVSRRYGRKLRERLRTARPGKERG